MQLNAFFSFLQIKEPTGVCKAKKKKKESTSSSLLFNNPYEKSLTFKIVLMVSFNYPLIHVDVSTTSKLTISHENFIHCFTYFVFSFSFSINSSSHIFYTHAYVHIHTIISNFLFNLLEMFMHMQKNERIYIFFKIKKCDEPNILCNNLVELFNHHNFLHLSFLI